MRVIIRRDRFIHTHADITLFIHMPTEASLSALTFVVQLSYVRTYIRSSLPAHPCKTRAKTVQTLIHSWRSREADGLECMCVSLDKQHLFTNLSLIEVSLIADQNNKFARFTRWNLPSGEIIWIHATLINLK